MRLRINGEFVVGVVAVILGLLAGALLMVATGNDAMEGYEFLFKGGLMNAGRQTWYALDLQRRCFLAVLRQSGAGAALPAERFRFSPPAGADVIRP